jgi:glycosyltransferase involved in cell wall biosynthesis
MVARSQRGRGLLKVYDLTIATRRPVLTGIERYAINMFKAAANNDDDVVGLVSDASLVGADYPVVEVGHYLKGWAGLTAMLPHETWKRSVVICACAPASPALRWSKVPIARVIHDGFPWQNSTRMPLMGRVMFRHYENMMLRRNDLIFAPTQIVREELMSVFDRSDIGCAGNAPGIDMDGALQPVGSIDLDTPFILMVGTVEPRKNYERLVRILEQGNIPNRKVVVVGRPGWHASGAKLADLASRDDVDLTWLDDSNDAELRWLYRHCALFVSLSHAEGFNMPLVEAGISGCPILCSDLPIHRAVAPPWAKFLVEGDDDNALRAMLGSDQPRPAEGSVSDYRHRFSWEAVVDNVHEPLSKIWQERQL